MAIPQDQNLPWSLDFVMDTLVSGRRFRILTLVDDFTRECLALVADTSLTGPRVVRELNRIVELRGCPHMIVSDNGTEFTSKRWRWHEIQQRALILVGARPTSRSRRQPLLRQIASASARLRCRGGRE
jgi:transposase InsO family protein